MNEPDRYGIDELRTIVAAMSHCRESFLQRFTTEQLIQIHRMWIACGVDIFPDTWTDEQGQGALAGKAPQWDEHEHAILDVVGVRP